MKDSNDLTFSEKKTKKMLYEVIGRKISEARKSSRRKLEGISKKLNISTDILKKIESGEIDTIEGDIPVTGFIRAFAKFTNTDISEEIEKLQSDYIVHDKPLSLYGQVPVIKASRILVVFLLSFSFLLLILYVLSIRDKKNDNILSEPSKSYIDESFVNENLVNKYEHKKDTFFEESKTKFQKVDDSYFEILFLEETWIEIYSSDKSLIESGLYRVGDSLNFVFENPDSDFFIKSGNLGGFQIFFKDEFFAPFGYSGEVNKGFYLKEKIEKIERMRL